MPGLNWKALSGETDEERERRYKQHRKECTAETWEEAFEKAIPRLKEAAADERAEIAFDPSVSPYFPAQVEQHEFAQAAWLEERAAAQPVIAELEKRIADLEQLARDRTAVRVIGKFGECTIAENLKDNDIKSVVDW